MSAIRPIDTSDVHRICSGQVVVDLCGGVKELVENALDAKAKRVEVRLQHFGFDSFEVVDDGAGIPKEDRANVCLKHWTSKIRVFEDLQGIASFGFRGEALSSLCETAKALTITTRCESDTTAEKLVYDHAGKLISSSVAARPVGTTVTVTSLFEHLPVRRKEFEKNHRKHYANLLSLIQAYAIVSEGVRVSLVNHQRDGKKMVAIATQGSDKMGSNLASVFGSKFVEELTHVEFNFTIPFRKPASSFLSAAQRTSSLVEDDSDDRDTASQDSAAGALSSCSSTAHAGQPDLNVQISGYVSKASSTGLGRSGTDRQFFFVNGRPAELKRFVKVVNDVWRQFEMNHKPACVLNIKLPPGSFDVNLTPDKREILIEREGDILNRLKESLSTIWESSRYTFPMSQQLESIRSSSSQNSFSLRHENETGEESPTSSTLSSQQRSSSSSFELKTNDSQVATPSYNQKNQGQVADKSEEMMAGRALVTNRPDESSLSPLQVDSVGSSRGANLVKSSSNESKATLGSATSTGDSLNNNESENGFNESLVSTIGPNAAGNRVEGTLSPNRGKDLTSTLDDSDEEMQTRHSSTTARLERRTKVSERALDDPKKGLLGRFGFNQRSKNVGGHGRSRDEEEDEVGDDRGSVVIDDEDDDDEDDKKGSHQIKRLRRSTIAVDVRQEVQNVEESFRSEDLDSIVEVNDNNNEATTEGVDSKKKKKKISKGTNGEDEGEVLLGENKEDQEEDLNLGTVQPTGSKMKNQKSVHSHSVTSFNLGGDASYLLQLEREWEQSKDAKRKTTGKGAGTKRISDEDLTVEDDTLAVEKLKRVLKKNDFLEAEIVGQFNLGFIIAHIHDELFILDQHASDEKYRFETLQQATTIDEQPLIAPLPVELTPMEAQVVRDFRQVFAANGFHFNDENEDVANEDDMDHIESTPRMLALTRIPHSKQTTFGVEDVRELAALLRDDPPLPGKYPRLPKLYAMFASRACRSAIMIGDSLPPVQMAKVVANLSKLDQPWNCPHGRPTMRHLVHLPELEETEIDGD